ncbi:MAG TPA: metalloregulator ArsR/SmtB family transcription factor [Dehalococcoidia bacterium]|nr:metalloregulator ArsR/SmtB family transcription factor [Dehalococcoidia bacterium]
MSHRAFKNRLYAEFARLGSCLASDKRLELLDLLAQAPRHVEALAAETEMSVANVSQHLQALRQAKLVTAEKAGNRVVYRLAGDDVLDLWLTLRAAAERRLPEVRQLASDFGLASPGLGREALQQAIGSDNILVIDVRPAVEFASGHIPGALPVPIEELPARLDSLPKDRRIVAYCRGAYCLFADEAVALLREKGFDAVRVEGGWAEWRAEGRPQEG